MTNRDELLSRLQVMAITNRLIARGNLEEIARQLLEGGATAIMLREHDLRPAELHALAQRIQPLCREAGALFIVNTSVEVALAVGADGVHLGRLAIPPARARKLMPPPLLCGFSAHDQKEVERAAEWGMDYCTLSPVFFPTSKEMSSPMLGIEGLARIAGSTPIPVIALGGITLENARACIDAGAVGIAAIGTLFGAENPRNAAAALRAAVTGAHA